ncbi:MAG: hypothetical protein JXP36_01755 [Bacteroidales bacterium]|nr:hypothetical protein [Bacteroidales bacterium]
MERRILVTGIILALSIIAIIVIFFLRASSADSSNPIKAIPQDAALIIKLNNFNLLTDLSQNKYKIWEEAIKLEFIGKLNNEIKVMDSLIQTMPELSEIKQTEKLFISGHLSGAKNLYFLTILSLPDNLKEKGLLKILSELESENKCSYTSRKYEGNTIFSVNFSGNEKINFSLITNNQLVLSSSPVLIEDAIRQSTLSKSLLDNAEFAEILKTTGKNKEANIFVNLSKAEKFYSMYSGLKTSSIAKSKSAFGSWTELDINLKDNLILLNGFTLHSDSTVNFINTISKFEPSKIEAEMVLPSSVTGYLAFGITNAKEYYKEYLNYLDQLGKLNTYKANLANLYEKYGVDFIKLFLNQLDNEITLACKSSTATNSESYHLLLKTKSGTEAEKAIKQTITKLEAKFNDKLTYTYKPDNEFSYEVYRIPIYPLFERLIGELFNVFDDNYLTIIDNYIVVSGTYKETCEFINEYSVKKTLANDEFYQNFASSLSSKSHLIFYNNISNPNGFFTKYLNKQIIDGIEKNKNTFQKLSTIGVQLSDVSGNPYFNTFINYQEDFKGKPRTVWESLLDSTISNKPKFVTNHYTQQNEIFLQDDGNTIYLLNQSGRILWKLPLNEKINSDVYQIDFYKNGKFQYLFSTSSQIHLIDRNGNYVERYPINLKAKSTAGLALFDYEGNKNYRILIPCSDKQVYAYTKEGININGFGFKGSDHEVTQIINHFRVENKDFIVFGDKSYTYVLDRKGDERVKLNEPVEKSKNNNYYLFDSGALSSSYITTTLKNGNIVTIDFEGKVGRKDLGEFSENHFFDFKDVDADGSPDYIITDKNTLYVFKTNGDRIFKKEFNEEIDLPPVYYHFSYSDRKIGLVSTRAQKIYLVNNNGEIYNNFPLTGTTQFSIGYFDLTTSRFNLIVGGRNNFLYNYTVE